LRAFAATTEMRSEGYYKAELARALQENPTNDIVLLDSLVAFFRANPRAIDRCEAAFLNGVLNSVNSNDVDVAIEDDGERERRYNAVVLGAGVALLLVGAGAAIDRAVTAVHAENYATPAPIVVYVTPQPRHIVAHRPPAHHPSVAPKRTTHRGHAPRVTNAHASRSGHRAGTHSKPVHIAKHSPAHKSPVHKPRRVVKYPEWQTQPARAESLAVRDPTPKPRTWLQRQLDHLNPFKKRAPSRTAAPDSPPQQ
jgi:hypothetical protein